MPQFTVLGNRVDGGNCELIAVPAVNVIPIPQSLDLIKPPAFLWFFSNSLAHARGSRGDPSGQTVLVLGAGSGWASRPFRSPNYFTRA